MFRSCEIEREQEDQGIVGEGERIGDGECLFIFGRKAQLRPTRGDEDPYLLRHGVGNSESESESELSSKQSVLLPS